MFEVSRTTVGGTQLLDATRYPTVQEAMESFRRFFRNNSIKDGCVRDFDGNVIADFAVVKRYLAKPISRC